MADDTPALCVCLSHKFINQVIVRSILTNCRTYAHMPRRNHPRHAHACSTNYVTIPAPKQSRMRQTTRGSFRIKASEHDSTKLTQTTDNSWASCPGHSASVGGRSPLAISTAGAMPSGSPLTDVSASLSFPLDPPRRPEHHESLLPCSPTLPTGSPCSDRVGGSERTTSSRPSSGESGRGGREPQHECSTLRTAVEVLENEPREILLDTRRGAREICDLEGEPSFH